MLFGFIQPETAVKSNRSTLDFRMCLIPKLLWYFVSLDQAQFDLCSSLQVEAAACYCYNSEQAMSRPCHGSCCAQSTHYSLAVAPPAIAFLRFEVLRNNRSCRNGQWCLLHKLLRFSWRYRLFRHTTLTSAATQVEGVDSTLQVVQHVHPACHCRF